ncbi:hypothetical protein A2U01_0064817, partial [Trifolium medium]|nr:hypothetical protein [Trifolium medium]
MADSLAQEIKGLYVKDPLTFPISEFESSSVLSEKLEQNKPVFDPERFQLLKTFLDCLRNVVQTKNDLDSSKSREALISEDRAKAVTNTREL